MKYLLIPILFLLNSQFLMAQDDGPYTDYYDSGELEIKGQYKNKKRVGNWTSYYKNGQISSQYSYNNGKRNSESISYFKNGIISYKTVKKEDDLISYGYYESGKLRFERQNNSGYYKSYFESGAIEVEAKYYENELVGDWKRYHENGGIEWLVTYKNGYRDGVYKQFYENGDLKLEGNNYRDKINGKESRFLPNNILEWQGSYKDGVLSNSWTKYNAKGKKIKKIKFKNGESTTTKIKEVLKPTTVANGVYETVAVYPGCEKMLTNTSRKKCMNTYVADVISKNFNTDVALKAKVLGRQRIFVTFKISKEGIVTSVMARATHPLLEKEAIRVIKLLPQLQPGTQRGKAVIMPFSIPIVFNVVK